MARWIILTDGGRYCEVGTEPRVGHLVETSQGVQAVELVLDGPDAPDLVSWFWRLKARLVG